MAPVVGALIGAAATWYGAKKAKDAAKKLQQQQQPLIDSQVETAKTLQPYIGEYFDRSKRAYDPAFSYYSALASGDRNRILGAVSPETDAIGRKYQSLIGASRTLNPRGGASATYNADLAFREADEKQGLVNRERSAAYGGLAGLASQAGQLGAAAGGVALPMGNSALNAMHGAFNDRMSADARANESYQQIAQYLMDAWNAHKGRK